jgi:hypothetical protein
MFICVSQDARVNLYYNNLSYAALMTCSERQIDGDVDRIAFAWYQLIVMFVFPVLTMLFCYSFVIAVLWNSTKEHARLTHSSRDRSVFVFIIHSESGSFFVVNDTVLHRQ